MNILSSNIQITNHSDFRTTRLQFCPMIMLIYCRLLNHRKPHIELNHQSLLRWLRRRRRRGVSTCFFSLTVGWSTSSHRQMLPSSPAPRIVLDNQNNVTIYLSKLKQKKWSKNIMYILKWTVSRTGGTSREALDCCTFHQRTLQSALSEICIAHYTAWKWVSVCMQEQLS